MCDGIRPVTAADIRRVADTTFGRGSAGRLPTVVTMGHENVRDWRETLYAYGVGA